MSREERPRAGETHFVRSLDLSLDAENSGKTAADLKAKKSEPALYEVEVENKRVERISQKSDRELRGLRKCAVTWYSLSKGRRVFSPTMRTACFVEVGSSVSATERMEKTRSARGRVERKGGDDLTHWE